MSNEEEKGGAMSQDTLTLEEAHYIFRFMTAVSFELNLIDDCGNHVLEVSEEDYALLKAAYGMRIEHNDSAIIAKATFLGIDVEANGRIQQSTFRIATKVWTRLKPPERGSEQEESNASQA